MDTQQIDKAITDHLRQLELLTRLKDRQRQLDALKQAQISEKTQLLIEQKTGQCEILKETIFRLYRIMHIHQEVKP